MTHPMTEHNMELGVFGKEKPVDITGTVKIAQQLSTLPQAADYGVWATYKLAGTETQPIPICGRDEYRSRVIILVQVAGAAGFVNIGSLKQFSNPVNPQGGRLFNGNSVEVRNKEGMFITPDGTNAATVTVLLERYDSEPDEYSAIGEG